MQNDSTNAPSVLAMVWGVLVVAVLYYFSVTMYGHAETATQLMLRGDNLFLRYFSGLLVAALAFPIAVLHWAALALLAPTRRVEKIQIPVVAVVAALMLTYAILAVIGSGYRSFGIVGDDGPGWFSRVFHVLLASAVVLAAVFIAALFARLLARTLVSLLATDPIREHFAGLYDDDHAAPTPTTSSTPAAPASDASTATDSSGLPEDTA